MNRKKLASRLGVDKEELEYRYSTLGMSAGDIAKLVGCSHRTILNHLRRYCIPIRTGKEAHNTGVYVGKFVVEIPEDDLRREYCDEQLGARVIGQRHGCSSVCVRNNMRRYNIPIRTRTEAQATPACINGRKKAAVFLHSLLNRENRWRSNIERYKDPQERYKTALASKRAFARDPTLSIRMTQAKKDKWASDPSRRIRLVQKLAEYWSHPENRKMVSQRFKRMWQNPTLRAKMIESRRRFWQSNSPEFINMRMKMIAGLNLRPNKPEMAVLTILNDMFPSEWEYVGDGQVIIGGLNPDIINVNGKKLIIEVFGDYWHTQKMKPYRINEGRVDVYAQYGYKTLIIWERETKNIDTLKTKILEFVH